MNDHESDAAAAAAEQAGWKEPTGNKVGPGGPDPWGRDQPGEIRLVWKDDFPIAAFSSASKLDEYLSSHESGLLQSRVYRMVLDQWPEWRAGKPADGETIASNRDPQERMSPWRQVMAVADQISSLSETLVPAAKTLNWPAKLRRAHEESEKELWAKLKQATRTVMMGPKTSSRHAPGRCWFFHDWSRWETRSEYKPFVVVRGPMAGKQLQEEVRTQERTCLRCGLREERGL